MSESGQGVQKQLEQQQGLVSASNQGAQVHLHVTNQSVSLASSFADHSAVRERKDRRLLDPRRLATCIHRDQLLTEIYSLPADTLCNVNLKYKQDFLLDMVRNALQIQVES